MARNNETDTDTGAVGPRAAFTALGRTVGVAVVDAQKATYDAVADCELKLAGVARVDPVERALRAHADFTRNVARRYASTTRGLIA